MALNSNFIIGDQPVQITNANVSAIRVQNNGAHPVLIMATVGENPPADWGGAIVVAQGDAVLADVTLAQLFPGVLGGNRVYAICMDGKATISVSHA